MLRIYQYIFENRWALDAPFADKMIGVLHREDMGEKLAAGKIEEIVEQRDGQRAEVVASGKRALAKDQAYRLQDGVGIVPVEGILSRYASMVGSASVMPGTSYDEVIDGIKGVAADPAAAAGVMMIDSPGGVIHGLEEVSAALADARKIKPFVCYAPNQTASAAYWIASQCDGIVCSPTAQLGSIGVMEAVRDTSAQTAASGVKIHLVKSAAHKGGGMMGTPVTETQLDGKQQNVNALHDRFVAVYGAGRGMPADQARYLADGRVHVGQEAVTLKLADKLGLLPDAIQMALAMAKRRKT